MTSPEDALASYNARGPRRADIGTPTSRGWLTAAALAADPDEHLGRLAGRFGGSPLVGGAFLVAWTSVAIAEPALRMRVHAGRIPALDTETVSIHPGPEGWVDSVAFASISAEPATGVDEALGRGLVVTLAPLVEAIHERVSIGRRGLWGLVADAVGGAAVLMANEDGDDTARVAADRVIDAMTPPCIARPQWRYVGPGLSMRRGSCCMAFHVDDHGYCPTCPMAGREAARAARNLRRTD